MRIPFDEISRRNLPGLTVLAGLWKLTRFSRHNFKHERLALDGLFNHPCWCRRPRSNPPAKIGIGDRGCRSYMPLFRGLNQDVVHEYRVSTSPFCEVRHG